MCRYLRIIPKYIVKQRVLTIRPLNRIVPLFITILYIDIIKNLSNNNHIKYIILYKAYIYSFAAIENINIGSQLLFKRNPIFMIYLFTDRTVLYLKQNILKPPTISPLLHPLHLHHAITK